MIKENMLVGMHLVSMTGCFLLQHVHLVHGEKDQQAPLCGTNRSPSSTSLLVCINSFSSSPFLARKTHIFSKNITIKNI